MSAHTPGPWSFHYNGNYWEFGNDHFQLGDACASQFTDPGKEEANARLIAAAPDLLGALEGLMPLYSRTKAEDATDALLAARAAIAKAKGESE